MSLDNEQSKVIQGRFHLTRKLGAGSFGEIFEAKDLKTGRLYACKAESLHTKHPQLRLEYQIYRALQQSKHFVRVWGYVTHYNHQIMIMDKLGDSLEQLFTSVGRKFSIRCVCAIAIQILTRIEELHKHHYLHRDIKPDNFLIGDKVEDKAKIFMIDLGLGKVWKEGGRHIPEKRGKRLIGTPRYASINTHFGHEQSRRDDLESLGYMLMYFAHGQLPWQGLRGQTKEEKYQKIGHKKRDTRLSEICRGYPDEFRQYLAATQKLAFTEEPPYEHYRALFRAVLKREQLRARPGQLDFDWLNKGMAKCLSVAKKSTSARQPRQMSAHRNKSLLAAQNQNQNPPQQQISSRRAISSQNQPQIQQYHGHAQFAAPSKRRTRSAAVQNGAIARPRSATRARNGVNSPGTGHHGTGLLASAVNVNAYRASTNNLNVQTASPPTNHHFANANVNAQRRANQLPPHTQSAGVAHSHSHLHTQTHSHSQSNGFNYASTRAASNPNPNPLQLPNLTTTAAVNALSPASAQQNYMDRYNRCRNIAAAVNAQTQNQSQSHPTSPHAHKLVSQNISNLVFQSSPNVSKLSAQSLQSSALMADYQELVGAYKKMEAQLVSAQTALVASEQKYTKVKAKCSQYAYTVQTQQTQIEQLSRQVQAYRSHKINSTLTLSQPEAKRRKLNSMQRTRAAAGM